MTEHGAARWRGRIAVAVLTAAALCIFKASANAESGGISYYRDPQPVACGGRFNPYAMTAAHKTLECGKKVRVTANGKSIVVTINDRGPYVAGRILDVSLAGARALGMIKAGVVHGSVQVLD